MLLPFKRSVLRTAHVVLSKLRPHSTITHAASKDMGGSPSLAAEQLMFEHYTQHQRTEPWLQHHVAKQIGK